MLLQLDTIGLMLIGFIRIFYRKYSLDVRGFSGGLQKSNHISLISLLVFGALSFCSISCLSKLLLREEKVKVQMCVTEHVNMVSMYYFTLQET